MYNNLDLSYLQIQNFGIKSNLIIVVYAYYTRIQKLNLIALNAAGIYRVLNIVLFSRFLESLPLLPRQHSAAISCTKNYQSIGVTVHSHCVESFDVLIHRGRGCSEM